ncbi:MBL fold metallo-hydrolase [Sphingobium sp. CAP-1]|uniref:MBL fold metallo-hydrolase n=1 Tax=Sphingobium sp. CAP-1 TaxID=2676077 RepID=UPI0012BB26A3|nr:MBL fold metallo-hydrolase [Sphingobium sp. CAP-1]QGP81143.1 MBL fold metallo-hydrolase [Sphingobium sp. CAP-1]
MEWNRRSMIGLLGATAALPIRLMAQDAMAKTAAKVTLLGTAGGPPAHVGRSQPASLLQIAGKAYLIDAGENVGQQLARADVVASKVNATLLTHLHWDHTLGLDYLMATGWMRGRRTPMPIWGPPGTDLLVGRTLQAIGVGEAIFRAQADKRPPLASLYPAREVDVDAPRQLFDDGTVKVSAIANTHFARIRSAPHAYGIDKAYSYRFETSAGAIIFTGDTGPSERLAGFAKGAALMVAEIVDLSSMEAALEAAGSKGEELHILMQHMEHQHLTADALGQLAAQAGVKKLALSHYVMGRDFNPADFVAPLRRHFSGEIIVGEDLAVIPL